MCTMAVAHSRVRPPPEGFPARLRSAREARGWSQGELGERAGFPPSPSAQLRISRWERGDGEPTLSQATALARVLGCGVEWLATGEGRAPIV